MQRDLTHLVKPKSFDFPAPRKATQKIVQRFAGISESREVLAQNNDDIRADLSGLSNELELM